MMIAVFLKADKSFQIFLPLTALKKIRPFPTPREANVVEE